MKKADGIKNLLKENTKPKVNTSINDRNDLEAFK